MKGKGNHEGSLFSYMSLLSLLVMWEVGGTAGTSLYPPLGTWQRRSGLGLLSLRPFFPFISQQRPQTKQLQAELLFSVQNYNQEAVLTTIRPGIMRCLSLLTVIAGKP